MSIYYSEGFTRENIEVKQMESVPIMASTIVTDGFYKKVDGLTPAYNAIAKWIEENGYQITGYPRELFYGSVESGDLTAEIQFPVGKA